MVTLKVYLTLIVVEFVPKASTAQVEALWRGKTLVQLVDMAQRQA